MEEMITRAIANLANHALEEKGYEFPFYLVAVCANGAVFAVRFAEPGKNSVPLCEYLPNKEDLVALPINVLLSCGNKEPLLARIEEDQESNEPRASWLN